MDSQLCVGGTTLLNLKPTWQEKVAWADLSQSTWSSSLAIWSLGMGVCRRRYFFPNFSLWLPIKGSYIWAHCWVTWFGECNMSRHTVKWDWVEALRAISWFTPALSSLLSQQLHVLVEGDVFLSLDLGRKEPLGSTRASLWLPCSVSEEKKGLCCWKPAQRGTWMLPQHSLVRDDS